MFAAAGIVTNITVSTSHNMRDTVIPYDCNLRHLLNWLCGIRQTTWDVRRAACNGSMQRQHPTAFGREAGEGRFRRKGAIYAAD